MANVSGRGERSVATCIRSQPDELRIVFCHAAIRQQEIVLKTHAGVALHADCTCYSRML